jgi:hypothetical protein
VQIVIDIKDGRPIVAGEAAKPAPKISAALRQRNRPVLAVLSG